MSNNEELPPSRWTCEACGCHTNTEIANPVSCGVCGTRRVPGHPHGRVRRGLWAIGGLAENNYDDEEDVDMEDEDEIDSEMEHSDEDAENANNRLSSMRSRGGNDMVSVVDRLSMALNPSSAIEFGDARPQEGEAAEAQLTDTNDLLARAGANGIVYSPKWSIIHCSSSMRVDEESQHQVACVNEGGNNGNCIRSSDAIPSFSALSATNSSPLVGWRIAFDLPAREQGRSGGGGSYFIGIVAEDFGDFNSRNGLQQSRLFWGVDDIGIKYDGGTRGMVASSSRTGVGARSPKSFLFALREVVTVVLDMEAMTLSMWRDSRFLGTILSGLPKGRTFFPVAIALNPGACVAITGLSNSPSVIMKEYLRAQQEIKEQKNDLCRNALKQRRATLLTEGQLSTELKSVLQTIWTWYCKPERDTFQDTISAIDASKLWYRSGLKFSRLCKLLHDTRRKEEQSDNMCDPYASSYHDQDQDFCFDQKVAFADFIEEVQHVVSEAEEKTTTHESSSETPSDRSLNASDINSTELLFQVGDKVEVAEGSDRYGDASSGPLKPGDLGTVIELQRGPRGDRQSVRVLFNGRRWWYQPQALVSERSGLVEPLAVRFLVDLLRSHGYDSYLVPLWGKSVTPDSWKVGDLVVTQQEENDPAMNGRSSIIGVISDVSLLNKRESGTVHVDYPNDATMSLNVSSLTHTTFHHMHSVLETYGTSIHSTTGTLAKCVNTNLTTGGEQHGESEDVTDFSCLPSSVIGNEKKLAPITLLDKSALQLLINDCKRKSSLARLFSAGLSNAILSGIELAHDKDVDISVLDAVGALCVAVCQQLFCPTTAENICYDCDASVSDSVPDISDVPDDNNAFDSIFAPPGSLRSLRNILSGRHGQLNVANAVDLRELVRDLGIGADQRRSVLLALMASERMQFEPRQFRRSAGSDEPIDRTRHSLSPFARLNAEAALGLPLSVNGHEENVLSLLHSSTRPSILGEQGSSAAIHAQKRFNMRKKSPSKALIHYGLLLDNTEWVKKFITLGVESKAQDDEGNSILLVAICLGCSRAIIEMLISTGFAVGHKEIQLAAYSDQPESLALLLSQAVYSDGLVDLKRCSVAVVDVIEAALEKQRRQEDDMREVSLEFGSSLLWKFVDLTMSFCVECKESQAKCCMDTLVGDVLLQAVCQRQSEAFADNDGTNDNARDVLFNATSAAAISSKSGLNHSSIGCSLIEILPAEVIVASLTNGKALSAFLRLMEMHLWNKSIDQSVVGLVLAECLIRKCPSLHASFFKYGLRELCNAHLNIAEDALLSIELMSSKTKTYYESAVVSCPNGHATALHLTRHSSFKCDLCGKGVEQGKPMYGCRECDWDACEKCTDKGEGGYAKWNFVKKIAKVCLEMLPSCSAEDASGLDELQRIVDSIKQRDPSGIRALGQLLDFAGKITLHEFTTLVLPALHFSLVSNFERDESEVSKDSHGTGHRKKKLRISSLRSKSRNASFYIQDKVSKYPNSDSDPYICALMMLLRSSNNTKPVSLPETSLDDRSLNESEESPSEDTTTSKPLSKRSIYVPPLLRMLHTSLAFHERLHVTRHKHLENEGELQSLLSTIEVELIPSQDPVRAVPWTDAGTKRLLCCQLEKNTVYAELLLPIVELQQQIIRSRGIRIPSYLKYCRQLVQDCAVVADRGPYIGESSKPNFSSWRVAQIVGFDEVTCAHVVRYASRHTPDDPSAPLVPKDTDYLLESNSPCIIDHLSFDGREAKLVLAARDYCVLRRFKHAQNDTFGEGNESRCLSTNDQAGSDFTDVELAAVLPPGTRVECDVKSPDGYNMYTIVSVQMKIRSSKESRKHSSTQTILSDDFVSYSAVSDGGEILDVLLGRSIRHYESMISERRAEYKRRHAMRDESSRLPTSNNTVNSRHQRSSAAGSVKADYGTLKRTWSALSKIQNMRPLELSGSRVGAIEDDFDRRIPVNCSAVELAPVIIVEFCHQDALSPVSVRHAARSTLFSTLNRLFRKNVNRANELLQEKKCSLTYSFAIQWPHDYSKGETLIPSVEGSSIPWIKRRWNESASTDVEELQFTGGAADSEPNDCAHESWYSLENAATAREGSCTRMQSALDNCDGLNAVSVQCLTVINILAEFYFTSRLDSKVAGSNVKKNRSTSSPLSLHSEDANMDERNISSIFVSKDLTKKLLDQLEDPLSVVSGALPDWCSIAPTFASFAFSHASRRLLLDRAAFGVSRAVFCQQETKVNVGPLRQRMASLRARAVELVTEAFSSDADDPTALQLQADELYGMEEALNARVAAQFRAQGWTEHALESAKAAIRRDHLLSDAASVMSHYACDATLNKRRLEVRFEGESGFDAASGDEAGVTRGFYADIAEALLSCDYIAGVFCPTACPSLTQLVDEHSSGREPLSSAEKLPLWIPDVDPSHKVIIPTPRAIADPSSLGVFPRPLGRSHPMRSAVLKEFRFMGRLFAAALRDRFIFPLPFSVSFLKLVQSRSFTEDSIMLSGVIESLRQYSINPSSSSTTVDNNSCTSSAQASSESSPVIQGEKGDLSSLYQNQLSLRALTTTKGCLESLDLPRPGFLGGEIYAVEHYICAALDNLEETEPNLTKEELRQRRQEIAADKSFARKALGKSYDCSFEEYFEDRTFVDPLDPLQDQNAWPLCPNGAQIPVTIENVRPWVALAKQFVLFDGIVAQADAFRQGVSDFFCVDALLLLTPRELYEDVCGGGDNVDSWDEDAIRSLLKLDGGKGAAEALVAVAALGGDGGAALSRRFGPSSPTIGYLTKSLLEATPTQRRQFLSFVTSVPIVTPGKIEVVPVVSPSGEFLPMRDPGCMPRANTCARRLYLPKFDSYALFKQVFYSVIKEESRFKGFYEWRG